MERSHQPCLPATRDDTHGCLSGRYIRVTATQLAPRQNDFIFALAELEVMTAEGTNAARGAAVTAFDSIEAPERWQKSNLTDGWFPGLARKESRDVETAKQRRQDLIANFTEAGESIEYT